MNTKRVASELSGLLLVDKPSGMTSHDVVSHVRKILGQRSVGHTGTLDPLASGLMVLLLGEATKISDYVLGGDKGYQLKARFGIRTDTLDIQGQILDKKEVKLDPEVIRAEAEKLTGVIDLPVPNYSAVKVGGKKLYEYARSEKPVEVPVRPMRFYQFSPIEITSDTLSAVLKCGKGGFIRSWVAELGERLGVGAVVEELRREWSEPYNIDGAIDLATLEKKKETNELASVIIPLERCLPDWKTLTVAGRDEKLMIHGQIPNNLGQRLIPEQKMANLLKKPIGIKIVAASHGGLLSLLEAQPFKGLKIRRIFHFN